MKWFTDRVLPALVTAALIGNLAALHQFSERLTRLETRLDEIQRHSLAVR